MSYDVASTLIVAVMNLPPDLLAIWSKRFLFKNFTLNQRHGFLVCFEISSKLGFQVLGAWSRFPFPHFSMFL